MCAGAMQARGADAASGGGISKACHQPWVHQPWCSIASFAKRNRHAPAGGDIRHNLMQFALKRHQMRRIIGAQIKAQFKITRNGGQ